MLQSSVEKIVVMRIIPERVFTAGPPTTEVVEHRLYADVRYQSTEAEWKNVLVEIAVMVTETYTNGKLTSVAQTTAPGDITQQMIEDAVDAAILVENTSRLAEMQKNILVKEATEFVYPLVFDEGNN